MKTQFAKYVYIKKYNCLYLSRLVVGSSRAIIPQFSANVSARANLIIKHART